MRYLLGDLPEEEQARLEDLAFSDRECLQNILDAENDLIDEYVRGALMATARRQFESRFLASAERQRKVEFARALARVASATTMEEAARPVAVTAQGSWWKSFRAFLGGLNPAFQFSLAAAALLLAVGLPWQVAQTLRLRAQVAQLEAQQQSSTEASTQTGELRGQLAEQQQRNEELVRQLEVERQQIAQLQEDLANARPVIASLLLLPGLPRGSAQTPQFLVPRGAQQARLRLGLERGDDYKRFRVELRTIGGREVLQRNNLVAGASRAGREVVLLLPASSLNAGEYELALKGITEKEVVDIGYYYFNLLKR